MYRKELGEIWGEVHPDLPIERGNLADTIITEGIEAGGLDPREIAGGLYRLANDIEAFANAVVERAQALA